MPIEEKSWKEIEQEYAQRKQERYDKGGKPGHWVKCPKCQGSFKVTCPACKGLGRNMAIAYRKEPCPTCHGTTRADCAEPGCQGGWVWMPDQKAGG
jgi:DnaJ-class molecular chaperone